MHADNGGKGVFEYAVDSIYTVFGDELAKGFQRIQEELELHEINPSKLKFVEVGLGNLENMGDLIMGDIILVMRHKQSFYMIRFTQCFCLVDHWKIGPMVEWVGQVTK